MRARLLAAILVAGVAVADEATDARFHERQAIAAHRKGRLDEALEHFFLANRLAPTSSTLLNIAVLLEATGRSDEAFVYYREAQAATEANAEDKKIAEERFRRLVPRLARVRVESEPPGAAIYVDRETLGEYGRTPRVLALPRGKHEVIVRITGHHDERVPVVAQVGQEIVVRAHLRPVIANVTVRSDPPGADVFVDRAERSSGTTPITLALPVGRRVLEARFVGRDPDAREVEVVAGQPAEVWLRPAAPSRPVGALTVTSNVAGALVRLDGQDAGFAPLGRGDVDVGGRRVDLRLPGYRSWGGDVPVGPGQPSYVAVTLEREDQREGRGPWPWVVGGFAAASLAAGAIVGLLAVEAKDEFENNPTAEGYDRVNFRNGVADTLFIAGGAAAVTSAALFLLIPSQARRESRAEITTPR